MYRNSGVTLHPELHKPLLRGICSWCVHDVSMERPLPPRAARVPTTACQRPKHHRAASNPPRPRTCRSPADPSTRGRSHTRLIHEEMDVTLELFRLRLHAHGPGRFGVFATAVLVAVAILPLKLTGH